MGENTGTDTGTADAGATDGMGLDEAIAAAWDETGADAGASNVAAEPNNAGDADRAAAEQTAAAATDDQAAASKPAAEEAKPAESGWNDADDAVLARQTPEVQSLVAKRVASLQAENAPAVEMAAGIRKIVENNGFGETLRQSGMNEVQGVEYLANLEKFAREKPADYLRFVANHVKERFGLDPAKELGLAGQPQTQQQPTPDDAFVDPRVDQLQQRLDRQEQQAAEATRQRVLADAGNQIAAIRDAKGPDGKPLRPHFAAVEGDMAALVRANPNMTLEAAYDAAVWSNPTVRAQLQQEERAAAERKSRSEAANAAKASKANVRAGQRSMTATPNINSTDDAVRAALDDLGI